MEEGHYYTGIRKLRSLYSQKLQSAVSAFAKYGGDAVRTVDTQSGINLTLKVRSRKKADELCADARSIGLHMVPLSELTDQETSALIFYYNQVPLEKRNDLIKQSTDLWQS